MEYWNGKINVVFTAVSVSGSKLVPVQQMF